MVVRRRILGGQEKERNVAEENARGIKEERKRCEGWDVGIYRTKEIEWKMEK